MQPSNIQFKWQNVKLGKVAGVLGGFAFKSSWFNTKRVGYPVIKIQNLTDGAVDVKNAEFIDIQNVNRDISKFQIKKGDFLVAMTGATAGKVGVVTQEGIFYLNQRVGKFYSKNAKQLNKKYLYYSLINPKNLNLLKKLADGSAQGNMSSSQIEDVLEIALPEDINDQEYIADILSVFDDKIEVNNKISRTLEQVAQTIFKEWFVNFRFPGHEKMKMVDSELGKIPEGWEISKVGVVANNHDSKRIPLSAMERDKRKGNIPYYGANGILDYVDKAIFSGEYILFAEDGTVKTDKNTPVIFLVNENFWVNNHAHILSGGKVSTYFLYLSLLNIPVDQYITGGVQPKITQQNLNSILVVLPTRDMQKKFESIAQPINEKLQIAARENQKLATLRDLFLPKLMSGEIKV